MIENEETRARLRVVGAFLGGSLLVAVPLFLWNRAHAPHTVIVDTEPNDAGSGDGGAPTIASAPPVVDAGAAASVTVGPPRVLECHDSGSTRTSPADCDHPAAIETGLANAIVAGAACAKGEYGTIGFEADVSLLRKHNPVELRAPHDERTVKSAKVARDCAIEVKRVWLAAATADGGALAPSLFAGPHAHERYRILVTASYAAP